MKIFKNKFILLLIALAVFSVAGRTNENVPLLSRLIIVGIGIEQLEDNQFEVSLMTITAGNNIDTSPSGYKVVSEKAETIKQSLDKIANSEGKKISFAHCNIVLLGESIITNNAYYILDYLVRESQIPEMCKVLAVEGEVLDFMTAPIAQANVGLLRLNTILSEYSIVNNLMLTSIKDLVLDYSEYEGACALTQVSIIPLEKDSFSSVKDKQEYDYKIGDLLIFDRSGKLMKVDEDVSNGLKLFEDKIDSGTEIYINDKNELISFQVQEIDNKRKFTYDTSPKIEVELVIKIATKEVDKFGTITKPIYSGALSEADQINIAKNYEKSLKDAYKLVADEGIDILHLIDRFSRVYPNKTQDLKLQDIELIVNARITLE